MKLLNPLSALLSFLRRLWERWNVLLTEPLLQARLRSERCALFAVCKGKSFEIGQMPNVADAIAPTFTVHAEGFTRFVPSAKALLTFVLDASGRRYPIGRFHVILSSQPLAVRNVAFRWKGSCLDGIRGQATLRGFVGKREVISLPFIVVTWDDLARSLAVESVNLNAKLNDGRLIRMPGQVGVEQIGTLAPEFSVRCPAYAPMWSFQGRLLLHQGATLLAGVPFSLVPDSGTIAFKVKPTTVPKSLSPGTPLCLRIEIATITKVRTIIHVLPSAPITNYEGTLTSQASNNGDSVSSSTMAEMVRNLRELS